MYVFELEQVGVGWDVKDTVDRGIDVSKLDFYLVEHGVDFKRIHYLSEREDTNP